jgi:hypothetical protein
MRDHKTGYHWIWMTPILFLVLLTSAAVHKMAQLCVRLRSTYLSRRHPEIARMKKLAGVTKRD